MATERTANTRLSDGMSSSPSPVLSPTSTLFEDSPRAPVRHRPTFARLASVMDGDTQRYDAVKDEDDITETPKIRETQSSTGLGISYKTNPAEILQFAKPRIVGDVDTAYDPGSPYWSSKGPKHSVSSFQSTLQQSVTSPDDMQPLRGKKSFADTLRMNYEGRLMVTNHRLDHVLN